MSFNDLIIIEYTEKSIAIQGDTRKYKEDLKKLGGKYNENLKNGPGWIFPKSKLEDLTDFIKKGKRLDSTVPYSTVPYSKVPFEPKESRHSFSVPPTLTEFSILLNLLKDVNKRTERLETALGLLLSDEQREKLTAILNPVPVKKVIKKPEKNESDNEEDSDSDSDSPPPRRLLRR